MNTALMLKHIFKWVIVTILPLIAACSTTTIIPKQHVYLLRTLPAVSADTVLADVKMERVNLPTYLQKDPLVLMVSEREIRSANHHRWGEPLDRAIGRYLRQRLAEALAAAHYKQAVQIQLVVDELLGSLDGRVHLRGGFKVYGNKGDVAGGRLELNTNQEGEGYEALVVAHELLLDQAAQQIASAIIQAG
ncbi:MAG: membrane integrity-associated transporter subunit PqiC [Parahaliea sp.]